MNTYIQAIRGTSAPVRFFFLSTILYWSGMTLMQLYLNFFLQSLKLDQMWIGVINATPQLTVVAMTLVVGGVSSRLGPWRAALLGMAVMSVGLAATAFANGAWWVFSATVVGGAGGGFVFSNSGPFIMAHSDDKARATLFSLQAAIGTLTGFFAYMVGGQLPALLGGMLGAPRDADGVMRAILLVAATFYALALIPMFVAGRVGKAKAASDKAEAPKADGDGETRKRFITNRALVARLLLPGGLVALGAGMTMPFMNIYIERKFNLSFESLGQIFAWTAIATAVAMLVQPIIAERFGKVKSVVIVQGASLPFLMVLGYVEFFPLVAAALFVRAALMNMGNPVFSAYSMGRIPERERATFASLSASTWSLGWACGSWFSGTLRGMIGFIEGFNILFGAMAVLYTTSMALMWVWFVGHEAQERQQERDEEKGEERKTQPAAA